MRTKLLLAVLCAACLAIAACPRARAADAAAPIGRPVLEPATLHSLGAYWIVRGDDNRNATVALSHRKAGAAEWRAGMPLFRVEKGAHQPEKAPSKLDVPADGWLFAGSALLLDPDTEYDLRLTLRDPDGGAAEEVLRARTIAEPKVPAGAPRLHVVSGAGGGSGTAADPYRGLAAAQERARPGDVFLLHAGTYEGTFEVTKSGEPGQPIVWRGAGDGEAILDAQVPPRFGGSGGPEKRPGRGISAGDVHDVWFEGLTIRNADYGLVGHRSARLVVRRCHIHAVEYGITFTNNDRDTTNGWFISDNVIEGPSTWPRTHGIENARGIQATGTGHVVCYNRFRGFADAVDTFGSQRCAAIDFHNNEISEMTDDGIEMDYSERNTRCFHNRLTNVYQGISVQPIFGGPVYIFRNAVYNVVVETFKMHNRPSGALMLHNTSVKQGMPLLLYTSEKVRNSVYRNNLFVGTAGNYAYETTAPTEGCDFDCDGFAGGPWRNFLSWNRTRYATLDEVKAKAPVYRHGVLVEADPFAGGIRPPQDPKQQANVAANDLRLKPGSAAVDAGQPLPGLNDGFAGKAPDLGAYELGAPLPHYGPRPASPAEK